MPSDSTLPIKLTVISPCGALPQVLCSGVTLIAADNLNGKGGGSYGIKKGHAQALIALGKGELKASDGTDTIFTCRIDGGFATVFDNTVTIVTREYEV